ncbi:uncharacterized protein LOC142982809 [Anticarsia gemmatalis]|uniref:uncharacterized protein LOC142982809 n=1 Tax=Anticarsia gemmatalis TaxID=129554 RepID=UPI003F75E35F
MWASVVLRYLFAFILVNACCGIPSFYSPSMDKQINNMLDKIMEGARYNCQVCEHSECYESPVEECTGALYCFKAARLTRNGTLLHSRGCITQLDQYQYTCKRLFRSVRKRQPGKFNVTCCSGDLCNGGSFPEIYFEPSTKSPPTTSNDFTFSVFNGTMVQPMEPSIKIPIIDDNA